MDPHVYCRESVAELLAERVRRGSDPARLQQAVMLAYFVERRPSHEDFARELHALAAGVHGGPGVAAAAHAILRDWQAGAAG